MFEKLAIWWRFRKLRAWINVWQWNREQYIEWRDRFITKDEKDELKQKYYLMKHDQAMSRITTDLSFDMHVPKNTWIPLGDGREFRYVTKNNTLHKLEVRTIEQDEEEEPASLVSE